MKINDALSGIVIALFAIAIYVYSGTLTAVGQDIGPNVFPQVLAAGFMICAVLLVVKGLRSLRKEAPAHVSTISTVGDGDPDEADARWITIPDWVREPRAVLAFCLIPLSLVFYIWVSESLGFIPTAFIMLMVLFLTFRTRLKVALPVALFSALLIHALFYKVLKVPLPWGVLQPVAW